MQQQTAGKKTTWSFIALGLALGLLLSSCSQVTPENVILEPQGPTLSLIGLNQKQLFSQEQTNCPIDQFDIPGQGFRARGSTDGLAVLDPTYKGMPTAVTSPATVGQEMYSLAAFSSLSRDVTILVVDDFNGDTTVTPAKPPVYRLGKEVFTLPDLFFIEKSPWTSLGPVEPLTLKQRQQLLDSEVRRLESTGQLAHGTLVMNHINAMILGTGAFWVADSDISDGKVSFRNSSTGTSLHVQAVDTEDLDTWTITPRLQNAIFDLIRTGQKQIVVNMSFSIVPCTVKSDFAANRSRYPTFETYANAVATANDALRGPSETVAQFQYRVRQQLTTPFDSDPLFWLIRNGNINVPLMNAGGSLLYVSASGNFGLDYSMYPAAWPTVVSVSSNDTGWSIPSVFSNKGEVMVTGAWYTLTDPAYINRVGSSTDKVVYAGTSFSSPAVAVFSAFDIASSTPKCETEFSIFNEPLPDIAHTPFDDRPLAAAISMYCD